MSDTVSKRFVVLHCDGERYAISAHELVAIDHDGPSARLSIETLRDLQDYLPRCTSGHAAVRLIVDVAGYRCGFKARAELQLVETNSIFAMPRLVRTIVKGDQTVLSVAAASVVAKTTRDALMEEEAEHFPAYGFESNRGYPAPLEKAALAAYGPSSIHRRSWIFMDYCLWGGIPRFERQPTLFSGASVSAGAGALGG